MMTLPFNGVDWMQRVAPYIAQSWIANLWQGMILALGVRLCLKLLPRISASTRFVVWIITFLMIALLPFLRLLPRLLSAEHAPVPQEFVPISHSVIQLDPHWALAITGVWFAAVLFQSVRLLIDLFRLRTIRKTSVSVAAQELNSELQELLRNATKRRVQLRISEGMDTPSAIGFFKPAVVIPRWLWEEFSPTQLKHVLVHELAHLRRYDDWTNLLQKLTQTLLPANPALYWVEKHLCFEREVACDDAVLSAEVTPRDYATCLTTLAGKKLEQRSIVLAPGAIEKRSDLARRVYRLLNRTRNSSLFVARGVAAGFLVATFSGAVAFTQCPQLISFASPEQLQPPTTLRTDRMLPAAKLELASMQMPTSSSSANSHLPKARPAVLAHKVTPKKKPAIAPLPAEQKASVVPQPESNNQVFVVLSVWQATENFQLSQTALIFTESGMPSTNRARSDARAHQSWFILQI
jgi:beta-lactamase regulating signal transducer with metallopeptidase domain